MSALTVELFWLTHLTELIYASVPNWNQSPNYTDLRKRSELKSVPNYTESRTELCWFTHTNRIELRTELCWLTHTNRIKSRTELRWFTHTTRLSHADWIMSTYAYNLNNNELSSNTDTRIQSELSYPTESWWLTHNRRYHSSCGRLWGLYVSSEMNHAHLKVYKSFEEKDLECEHSCKNKSHDKRVYWMIESQLQISISDFENFCDWTHVMCKYPQ